MGSCRQNELIDGAAVITLVFPPVTKTDYSEAAVQIYVRVGTGINPS